MVTSETLQPTTSLADLLEHNAAPAVARAQTISIPSKQRSWLHSLRTSPTYDQTKQRLEEVLEPVEGDSNSPKSIVIISSGILSPTRLRKAAIAADEAKLAVRSYVDLFDKVLFHKRTEFSFEEKSTLVDDAVDTITGILANLYAKSDYLQVRMASRRIDQSNKAVLRAVQDALDEKNMLYIELMTEFAKLKLQRTAALGGIDKDISEAYFNLYALDKDADVLCPTGALTSLKSPSPILDVDAQLYQRIVGAFPIVAKQEASAVFEPQTYVPKLQERIFSAVTRNMNHGLFTPHMNKCIEFFADDVASLNFSEAELEGLLTSLNESKITRNMNRRESRLSDKGVQILMGDIRVPLILGQLPNKSEINQMYEKVKSERPEYLDG